MQTIKYLKSKLGYGIGAIGLDLSYGMFYSYLAQYLTNVLGLAEGFLLILTPIARLWDGINDPMMGTIVDNTHTKMGKYRPWILRGSMLNAVVLVLLFSNPFKLTGGALMAYVAVMYVGWGMTNTLADIPYWSMVPSFTSDPKERSLISTLARTFSGLGQGIVAIGAPILMGFFSIKQYDAQGNVSSEFFGEKSFFVCAAVCAVMLVFFSSLSVATTKEKITTHTAEKFSFKKALTIIKSNDQLLVFMLFAMISNAGFYMTSGISVFYFTEVAGDLTLQSTFNLMGTVGSVLGILVVPVCSKFMNNRSIYKLSLLMAATGYIGMAVIGYGFGGNVVALGLCYIITSLGTASMFVNQTVMLADCVDYGEYKLGKRNQSLTFSMKGFLQKMAYTMQSIIMYASFALTKYDFSGENAETAIVTESAKSAISVMMFIVPPVLMLVSLVIFSTKFKIHGEYKQKILEEVAKRHEA